jgi:hypothetical protein
MRVRTVDSTHPDIEHSVLVRRQPTELRAIGRNLWIARARISEKDFPRKEQRQFSYHGPNREHESSSDNLFMRNPSATLLLAQWIYRIDHIHAINEARIA